MDESLDFSSFRLLSVALKSWITERALLRMEILEVWSLVSPTDLLRAWNSLFIS